MTFTGTLANINAALNGLTLHARPPTSTARTPLTITTNDLGNTGSRRRADRHRHRRDHRQRRQRRPGQHRAGRADHQRGHGLVVSSAAATSISDRATSTPAAGSSRSTLAVTNGTLTLARHDRPDRSRPATARADATMTFTGTLADINAALNGLTFSPTADYNGADTLTIDHRRPGQHRLRRRQDRHRHGRHHRQRRQRRAGQHRPGRRRPPTRTRPRRSRSASGNRSRRRPSTPRRPVSRSRSRVDQRHADAGAPRPA